MGLEAAVTEGTVAGEEGVACSGTGTRLDVSKGALVNCTSPFEKELACGPTQ